MACHLVKQRDIFTFTLKLKVKGVSKRTKILWSTRIKVPKQ